MDTDYNDHGINVNHHCCLTRYNNGCKKDNMTLAERICAARNYADLTQPALAIKANVSQQAISRLETGKQKTTTDIVAIAIACGVRPEWLSLEQGDMVDGLYVEGDKMKHLFRIAQELSEYALDDAIKRITDLAERERERAELDQLRQAAAEKK